MDIRQFFNEIPPKIREIGVFQDHIDQLQQDIDKIGDLDAYPSASGMIDLINNCQSRIRRLSEDVELAYQIINSVPTAKCRELLQFRYLTDQNRPVEWKDISKAMGFSVSHVHGYLFRKAMKEAEEVMNRLEERKGEGYGKEEG